MLHAWKLQIVLPGQSEPSIFMAPAPDRFYQCLNIKNINYSITQEFPFIMRHYFPRPTNLFILIFFLIANVNANEQVQDQSMSSEEEAIPEKRESQDNTTALIYHWLELARLYEQDCNEEMASMAYTQAQNLQNPSIIISLEELLSSALFPIS